LPFIGIRLEAGGRRDLPLLFALLHARDRPIRIDEADLGDVLIFDLEYFFLCLFLFFSFFFAAEFREVHITAENEKDEEEDCGAFEFHFLRFIHMETPAVRTLPGRNSSMTYETSRPCESVIVRRRSPEVFGRIDTKFSSCASQEIIFMKRSPF